MNFHIEKYIDLIDSRAHSIFESGGRRKHYSDIRQFMD